MRILVLRGGALGDFILTLPALRLLREHWPSAKIELVGNAYAAELALQSGILDTAYSQHEARWSSLFNQAPLPSSLASWFEAFDLIVSYWPDVDGTIRRHFVSRGAAFIGSHAHPTTLPASKHFCDALAPLGLATTDYRVRLGVPKTLKDEVLENYPECRQALALHPGSGSPLKNWPVERWCGLVAKLKQPILAITGEAESVRVPWPQSANVRTAHHWPLRVLAAALSCCSGYVGHDTGISHLAAAVGAPCVLLFGPTDPAIWAPSGEHVRVIKNGSQLSDIMIEEVLEYLR